MKKIGSYAAAILVCISMISVAASAAQENPKMIMDRDVDESFSFTLIELYEDPDLAWVLELIPQEWYEDLELDPDAEITVSLDGKVHVNAFMKDSGDMIRAKVHLAWHGSIGIHVEGMPSLNLELKNAQLMAEGYVPDSGMDSLDLKVNFHVNGVLTGQDEIQMDIGTHILLQVEDGQLTHLKIWVPDLFCLAESE